MGTLLLKRGDVADLLDIDECIAVIETAFRLHGEGRAERPGILGAHVEKGGFHIKAGTLRLQTNYFVAKINANFPGNSKQNGLPTIQGIVAVFDGQDGRLLALIDSIELTIIRTGAASAVAAKYLACPGSDTATICGCGNQGRISLKALMRVRSLKTVYVFDIDELSSQRFVKEFSSLVKVTAVGREQLSKVLRQSSIVVTCTPSREPYVHAQDIAPGTFIAAVGADSEEKQELFPDLLVENKIVVDIAEQSATIGELHHAIEEKKGSLASIHAELGMILAGKKTGRQSNREIIIFDSTGMALQDAAAASIVYEKALANKAGHSFSFSELPADDSNERDIHALRWWFPFR